MIVQQTEKITLPYLTVAVITTPLSIAKNKTLPHGVVYV